MNLPVCIYKSLYNRTNLSTSCQILYTLQNAWFVLWPLVMFFTYRSFEWMNDLTDWKVPNLFGIVKDRFFMNFKTIIFKIFIKILSSKRFFLIGYKISLERFDKSKWKLRWNVWNFFVVRSWSKPFLIPNDCIGKIRSKKKSLGYPYFILNLDYHSSG